MKMPGDGYYFSNAETQAPNALEKQYLSPGCFRTLMPYGKKLVTMLQ